MNDPLDLTQRIARLERLLTKSGVDELEQRVGALESPLRHGDKSHITGVTPIAVAATGVIGAGHGVANDRHVHPHGTGYLPDAHHAQVHTWIGTDHTYSFTAGSIVFAGVSGVPSQDNGNLFYDDSNNRLGLGLTNPTAILSLAAATTAAGGIAFGTDTNLYRSAVDTLKTDDSLVVATNLTVSTMTAGSVLFAGTSGLVSQDNTNLFWDNTNNWLGIQATPAYPLDVAGTVGAVTAKFGASIPFYLMANAPTLGMNVYYNSGWKFGAGSSSNYGAMVQADTTNGGITFAPTTNSGNAAGAATVTQMFYISPTSNVVPGSLSALATNATSGFLYIPTMAGTPTGDSTDYTGKLPMVYDTTGNKLWVNTSGTTWKSVALT